MKTLSSFVFALVSLDIKLIVQKDFRKIKKA